MRYRLRSLLILLAIGPPILAGGYWTQLKIVELHRQSQFDRLIKLIQDTVKPNSWEGVGGPGSIDQFETNCFLIPVIEPEPDIATINEGKSF